jgi:hypothetical protein
LPFRKLNSILFGQFTGRRGRDGAYGPTAGRRPMQN